MNDAQRHQRLMQLFDAACELPSGQRDAFLFQKCGSDQSLRRDLESLLEHDSQTNFPFDEMDGGKAVEWLAADLRADPAQLHDAGRTQLPVQIGAYRIVRMIGQGGMGIVYEAVQENPRRRVALKMVRPGLVSAQLHRRLQREANVLGRLQHSGIAQVYEAGLADVGGDKLPFFAMEYIDGERITTFAQKHSLSHRQCLALLARVCDAVHHAHQLGVIHRDIKPANILVLPSDADTTILESRTPSAAGSTTPDIVGQPKVLDFGIARVTDGDVQAATLQTDVGQIVGTLAYMSPEQVAGDSQKLDARCDVYALGVVLFEMLTGQLPLNVSKVSVAEAARIIRDDEVVSAGTINRSLRGDVDTIITKALEKEKSRRYASAAELASDIRRHLSDQPIVARRASAIYNLRKFARRNRVLVAGLVATFAALAMGLAGTTYFLVASIRNARESAQRAHELQTLVNAQEQLQKYNIRAMSDSLGEALIRSYRRELEADRKPPHEIDDSVAQLESTLQQLDLKNVTSEVLREDILGERIAAARKLLSDQPQVQAKLLKQFSDMARYWGMDQLSLEILDEASAVLMEMGRTEGTTSSGFELPLAIRYAELGRSDEAIAVGRRLLANAQVAGKEASAATTSYYIGLALIQAGRYDEAEPYAEAAVAYRTRESGDRSGGTVAALLRLGQIRTAHGRLDEAFELFNRALHAGHHLWGRRHPWTYKVLNALGVAHAAQGDGESAEKLLREALDGRREWFGQSHPDTLESYISLCTFLNEGARYDEAEQLAARAIVYACGSVSVRADCVAKLLRQRSRALAAAGSFADAEADLLEARAILVKEGRDAQDIEQSLKELREQCMKSVDQPSVGIGNP
jgi:non-specific serine/threonine protein kinase/serine/threonine-protein kinase